MDGREEKLRMKRDSFYSYILQLKERGFLPDMKSKNKGDKGKYGKKYKQNNFKKNHEQVEYVKKSSN